MADGMPPLSQARPEDRMLVHRIGVRSAMTRRLALASAIESETNRKPIELQAMATQTINTDEYTLYPSPQNQHRVLFEHQKFVAHPYALIHLPDFDFAGRVSLFAAHRRADNKMGQLVSCELAEDLARFERLFKPD